jgi:hypothetical protein
MFERGYHNIPKKESDDAITGVASNYNNEGYINNNVDKNM